MFRVKRLRSLQTGDFLRNDREDAPGSVDVNGATTGLGQTIPATTVKVITDSNGEAGIRYNIGESTEFREVTARVNLREEDADFQTTQEVIFG